MPLKKWKKTEIVDLTQDDNLLPTTGSPVTITLDDSAAITTTTASTTTTSRRVTQTGRVSTRRQPELIDVTDSDTESTHDQIQPTRIIRPPQPPPPPPESSQENSPKCPICLEPYKNVRERGLKLVVTRCGHVFCDFCLKKSIDGNGRKCPKCRKNVPKGPTSIIEVFDVW